MASDKNEKSETKAEGVAVAQALADLSRATVAPPSVPREKRPKVTVVKLLKRYGNNMAGETCGFAPEVAKQLVEMKAAELHKA